jgi:thioesterase domain-containing protein
MLSDTQRAALAARLRAGRQAPAPREDGPVVPLGTVGSVSAFAVHAVGGSVHDYAPLARELDGACRLYGVEAAGLKPGTTPVDSLARMADRYAAAVRAAQPDGPYRLIGWSMGGVLAYETARRLEAAGATVALVVLVDAPYRTVLAYADSDEGLAALFVADALRGAGRPPEGDPSLPVRAQLDRLAEQLVPNPDERDVIAGELHRRHAVFVAHTTALAGYLPDGPVDAAGLLVAAHGSKDSTRDWRRMFHGGVTATASPADHYGCLRRPAVAAVAAAVKTLI